jgi:hypothetical protein
MALRRGSGAFVRTRFVPHKGDHDRAPLEQPSPPALPARLRRESADIVE